MFTPFNPFWLAGTNQKITFGGPWTYFKLIVIFDFDLNIFIFVIFFGFVATTTTKAHLNFFLESLHATLDSQVPVFLGCLPPEGDYGMKLRKIKMFKSKSKITINLK